jgi:uncharacterized protein (DUF924 family)
MSRAALDAVHEFWFGRPGDPHHGEYRAEWFERNAAFDESIRLRFLADVEAAAHGVYDAHVADGPAAVALLVLIDQFPRNLFRATARAFATDAQARHWARAVVARGWDRTLLPVERLFAYLPFVHSETLADQDEAVRLMATLPDSAWRPKAVESTGKHRDVIVRFGRFPHRNAALGRVSTAEEEHYLAQPGAGF